MSWFTHVLNYSNKLSLGVLTPKRPRYVEIRNGKRRNGLTGSHGKARWEGQQTYALRPFKQREK